MAGESSQKKSYIECELLTYVFSYLSKSSADHIHKSVVQFYTPEDISKAKEALWNSYESHISTHLVNRRGGKESGASKDVQDIIRACQELDRKQLLRDDIVFFTTRLDKVPPHAPELLDMNSMLSRLSLLESNVANISTQQSTDAKRLSDRLLVLEKPYANAVKHTPPPTLTATAPHVSPAASPLLNPPLPPSPHTQQTPTTHPKQLTSSLQLDPHVSPPPPQHTPTTHPKQLISSSQLNAALANARTDDGRRDPTNDTDLFLVQNDTHGDTQHMPDDDNASNTSAATSGGSFTVQTRHTDPATRGAKVIMMCDSIPKYVQPGLFFGDRYAKIFRTGTAKDSLPVMSSFSKCDSVEVVIFHVGVRDCRSRTDTEAVVSETQALINCASQKYPRAVIMFSAILYIADDTVNDKIDIVNEKMKSFCSTRDQCLYIEHRKLQTSNSCYEDSVHINKDEGTKTFVKDITSTFIRHRQRTNTTGAHRSPTGTVSITRNGERKVNMSDNSSQKELIKMLTLQLLSQLSV